VSGELEGFQNARLRKLLDEERRLADALAVDLSWWTGFAQALSREAENRSPASLARWKASRRG
jgi:hypothetical protein